MWKLTPFSSAPRTRDDDFMDFADLVDDFFRPMRSIRHDTFKIDVEDKDNAYEIKADMPGINRDDIKVSYDDSILTIEVKHEEEKEDKDEEKNYLHRERRVTSMRRAINLPDIDPSNMKAKLEDGVLTIHAPKSEVQDQGYVVDVE
ncbi:MAG: Hsp20 family protein [Candidatus Izemoplasmataceae bacterium]